VQNFEDQEINGQVMLNWILGKLVVSGELVWTGSRSMLRISVASYHSSVYLFIRSAIYALKMLI